MANKKNWLGMAAIALAFGLVLAGCGDDGSGDRDRDGRRGALRYSVEVTKRTSPVTSISASRAAGGAVATVSAAASFDAGDTVELYIEIFEYCLDTAGEALVLIAKGDRDIGNGEWDFSNGPNPNGEMLNNAGWYSAESDLEVKNDFHNGQYSSFQVSITKLKVNGTEYDFPSLEESGRDAVFFGRPTSVWSMYGHSLGQVYPDNFSGITMTDSVSSLKTVLTVEPDILNDGVLADDPYQYIKVEGRTNEPSGGGGNESHREID